MTTTTPNALYSNADGTTDLVVLDSEDGFLETIQADLGDAEVEALHAGETDLRIVGHRVEVGDGDTFYRVEVR